MSPLMERTLLLLGILCCLQATTALMCYDCNSAYDPNCGDPFEPYTLGKVNCTQQEVKEHLKDKYTQPVLCRKTTQKVYGKVRVVRGCGYITDKSDDGLCLKRSGTHDVQAIYCACTGELCNHAASTLYQSNNHPIISALPYTLAAFFVWMATVSSHFNINTIGAVQNS
uniref:Uncharacterized protein n=1 Tax=Ceratitis capitata TaxID=7213 RepID=W8C743_CERCA